VAEPEVPRETLPGDIEQVSPVVGAVTAERATVPVKPFTLVAVKVEVPVTPELIVTLPGLGIIVKSSTITVIAAECDNERLVEVTVTVYVPAEPVHDNVEVTVVPRVTLLGVSVQLTPDAGSVEEASPTVPVNPLTALIVTIAVAAVPALTVTLEGDGRVTLKSSTLNVTVAE
jgi:hypothetical protein